MKKSDELKEDEVFPKTDEEEPAKEVYRESQKRFPLTATPKFWMGISFLLLGFILFNQLFTVNISPKRFTVSKGVVQNTSATPTGTVAGKADLSALSLEVMPKDGVELPVTFGDLGKQMIAAGVIDESKFRQLFTGNGEKITDEEEKLLVGNLTSKIKLNSENSRFLLDYLWALGLGNKSSVLDKGPMMEKPSDIGNFASTGGWTAANGKAVEHYSKHTFITLNANQEALVEEVAKGIYRPCCGNSTYFPDCNHGMAMLGLLELMAAQGVSREQMYKTALAVNSFWFPQTYVELAAYFSERGVDWDKVNPVEVLGANFSSGRGYQNIRTQIKSLPEPPKGGGGCGA